MKSVRLTVCSSCGGSIRVGDVYGSQPVGDGDRRLLFRCGFCDAEGFVDLSRQVLRALSVMFDGERVGPVVSVVVDEGLVDFLLQDLVVFNDLGDLEDLWGWEAEHGLVPRDVV